jgi:threonine synthase
VQEQQATIGWSLICPACGGVVPIGVYPDGCPACQARGVTEALQVHYPDPAPYPRPEGRPVGIWRNWGGWLPAVPEQHRITLGEGNTPLLRVEALCELTGCPNLYFKMEPQNPTGAHKDRFHAVNVAMAAALGMQGVVARSTGNHGLSMTAYCAAHGLRSVVVANQRMPVLLQRAIRFAGGLPLLVSPAIADDIVRSLVDTGRWLQATTAWPMPTANPYGIEGYKTIAHEIFRDLGERLPDRILIPTAGGDLLTGISLGQQEVLRAGFPVQPASLVACQPSGAAPLVAAIERGLDEVPFLPDADSIALSIGDPITGKNALRAVRETEGDAVAVSDEEILDAGRLFAKTGLFIEPSSAAPLAVLRKLVREQPEIRDETIVCVLTSSALKWLDDYGDASAKPGVEAGSLDQALTEIDGFLRR